VNLSATLKEIYLKEGFLKKKEEGSISKHALENGLKAHYLASG
jgi:hypothetical protein